MSSTTLTEDIPDTKPQTANSAWAKPAEFDEFDYIPVSPWGPVAMVLGIASLTGFTNSLFGLGLAAMGVIIGIAAVFRIRAASGAAKGTWMAVVGALMSVVCMTFGSMKLANAYETECPEGFKRVNFPKEISAHQFVYYGGLRRLHPKVAPLIGEKVFLKGFMWQTQRSDGLTEFVFLKDNGECCFGGDPKPFDMMVVHMVEGQTTDAYTGMVAVAGTLNANVRAAEGEPVYTVDATMVEEARTSF